MDDTTSEDLREKDRNFVTALARGLDILRCFRPLEPVLTNTDIAQRTGLPKPTVSRLTHTLCKLDYLAVDPQTGAYRLGAGVLALGFGVLSSMDMGEHAMLEMQALRDGPNPYITVALGERFQMQVMYIAVQRSREDVSLMVNVGTSLPLFSSSIGRAILAGLEDGARSDLIEHFSSLEPENAARFQDTAEAARAELAEKGHCSSYGEWREDVNGIAVPVRSLSGQKLYGLNVGGPSFRVSRKELENVYADMLQTAARKLSTGNA